MWMSDNTEPIRPDTSVPAGGRSNEVRESHSGTGRRRINTRSEWFWPVVNLLGLVMVVAVNALANITEFNGLTTGEVINRDPVYFQPAGWTFSIWSLIYGLLAIFVIYSFLPAGRRNPRVLRIGPAFLMANLANVVWLVLWHYERWVGTLIAMSLLFIALVLIYYGLRRRDPLGQAARLERLVVWTPFSVYLGWITVALLANVTVWMERTGTQLAEVSPRWWAVLAIVIAVAAAALMAVWRRDPSYTLVVTWGIAGVAAEQWDRSKLVSIAAIIAGLVLVALTVFASLLAYEARETRHELPQHARGQAGQNRSGDEDARMSGTESSSAH